MNILHRKGSRTAAIALGLAAAVIVPVYSQPLISSPVLGAHPQSLSPNAGRVSVTVEMSPRQREYTYYFSGQVKCQGRACNDAQVQIRVITDTGAQSAESITSADGS